MIEIVSTNSIRDLRRREADIAIRSGRPTDPEMIGRKLLQSVARLYASNDYIEEYGSFDTPASLAHRELRTSRRVRLVFEWLAARLEHQR